MIDTHTHLYRSESFTAAEAQEAVRRAINAGVTKLILPNVNLQTIEPVREMYKLFPDNITIAMGIHPTDIGENWEEELKIIEKHIPEPGVTAIGEVGIDLYWDDTKLDIQKKVFSSQLKMAANHRLPVLIHQRSALNETLSVIKEIDIKNIPAIVFHCFTEGTASVRKIREIVPDALFGIGGVSTFKNAGELTAAIPEIGIEYIVLETDSPYLAPVPHRGKRNESCYIPIIAERLSEILNLPLSTIEEYTTSNAQILLK